MSHQVKLVLQNSTLFLFVSLFYIATRNELRSANKEITSDASSQNTDQEVQLLNNQIQNKFGDANDRSVIDEIVGDVANKTILVQEQDALIMPRRYQELDILTLVNKQILHMDLINKPTSFNFSGVEGNIRIQDIRVTDFKPPEISVVHFHEPQSILFDMANIEANLDGHIVILVAEIALAGSVQVELKEIAISITTDVITGGSIRPIGLNVSSCDITVQMIQITINSDAPFRGVMKRFESHISEAARKHLPKVLCSYFKQMIDEQGTTMLEILLEKSSNYANSIKEWNEVDFLGAFRQKLQQCKIDLCNLLRSFKFEEY